MSLTHSISTPRLSAFWSTPERLFHWLVAACMAGAALTPGASLAHEVFGIGALLLVIGWPSRRPFAPARIVVGLSLAGLALSGWLAPYGVLHPAFTLLTLVLGAFYVATVLYEGLRRLDSGDSAHAA